MSQPSNLPNIGASNWLTLYYDWRPAPSHNTATHYTYGMYDIANQAYYDFPGSLIQVEISTNTWSDYDNQNHPNSVVDNGTTVTFDYSGAGYEFTKPSPWWTTGGGNSGSNSASNGASSTPKKVFCNFW